MRLFLWIKKEIFYIFLVFFFFLIFFTLINWIETFLFERAGVTPFSFLEVAIAAALIAKIVIVVDHLPFINFFRKRPLAYSIFWKTTLYWIILLLVRVLIRFVPFLFGAESGFKGDLAQFVNQVNWNLFISVQAFYLMLLFIFVTFQELAFRIGPYKMRRIFFGR
ncbi:MAG: hypothetical protein HZB76_04355 [Chlamydiae bacterium]|nr:hypothetical protein [Chlamydiota bacterium]